MACLDPRISQHILQSVKSKGQANQFVKKVILSEDMVVVALLQLVRPLLRYQGEEEEACSFRSYYADQVRNGVFSASLPAEPHASSVSPFHPLMV